MRMPLCLGVLLMTGCATTQDLERDAQGLHAVFSAETERLRPRPLLFSLIPDADSSTGRSLASLGFRLRASGVALAPSAASPGGDTVWVRVSRPRRDSVNSYTLGVERYTCHGGQLVGERAIVHVRCDASRCRTMSEDPLPNVMSEQAACG